MVVEEEACGDVEGYEDIDGVVLMGRQDEENPKQVQHPGDGMDQIPVSRCVWKYKKLAEQTW